MRGFKEALQLRQKPRTRYPIDGPVIARQRHVHATACFHDTCNDNRHVPNRADGK